MKESFIFTKLKLVYVLLSRSMDDFVWLRRLIDHMSAYGMLAIVASYEVGVLGAILVFC